MRCQNRVRYGVRRARPLARRLARTLRPLAVAIRARKPCVRLRCKLLGWKVLFIRAYPGNAKVLGKTKGCTSEEAANCTRRQALVSIRSGLRTARRGLWITASLWV